MNIIKIILYPSPLAPFFGNEEDLKLRCKLEWPKGFGPFLRGFGHGFREREGSIFSNHQHFAVSTGIYAELHALFSE